MKYGPQERKVAYFSLEIGLSPEMPTYAGGLGILAGDTIKSFADQKVPVVALTLLNEKGYFFQQIGEDGYQREAPVNWDYKKHLTPLNEKVTVRLEGRDVLIQGWVYEVQGSSAASVPVIFLDTNIDKNNPEDRGITSYLYGGDRKYRLKQEAILGIGGVRMLQILDHDNLVSYHMNEGHSALLTLELMDRYQKDLDRVRELCVFTTHTPVPAGHDCFEQQTVEEVLGDYVNVGELSKDGIMDDSMCLNMTFLGMYHSKYINGVAKKHGQVAQKMFPHYSIEAITNGIHTSTWVSDDMAGVFDSYIPSWRVDPYALRGALSIPRHEIWKAHAASKKKLLDFVNENYGASLQKDVLTIGFARRAAAYKRADLLFTDKKRLFDIIDKEGKIQAIFGGKAHPHDTQGKKIIQNVINNIREISDKAEMVYLNNYDMYSAKLLVSGVDVWLNTPQRPQEASGTSGMKAAANGVLNFSVLDGWWIEGHIEDFTGWSIGPHPSLESQEDPEKDVKDLYDKLESKILPLYYYNKPHWKHMMAYNIAVNASFFNTHRMVSQYVTNAYFQ